MIEIRRILCPIDFSELSRRALDHAVALARWYEAEIAAIHVLPIAVPPLGGFPYYAAAPALREPEIRARLLEELRHFLHPARDRGLTVAATVEEGNPVGEILWQARELPADLLVIATHGRGGFERWVLGSVTEKVLRKASCPVLTVPPRVEGPAPEGAGLFKRILCAVDFSEASLRALEYALSLAQEADTELTLLHVVEALPPDHSLTPVHPDLSEVQLHLEREALDVLRRVVPAAARDWCKPREVTATGKPHQEILRVAGEAHAGLIVMGVHGRGAVDRMLFGSTTHHVVREAGCPVLTVKPH